MESTRPKVLIAHVGGGEVSYVVFATLDEKARDVLGRAVESSVEQGWAFAEWDAFWVQKGTPETGDEADYVYQGLLQTGIEVCWPSGESIYLGEEALDDIDEMCRQAQRFNDS